MRSWQHCSTSAAQCKLPQAWRLNSRCDGLARLNYKPASEERQPRNRTTHHQPSASKMLGTLCSVNYRQGWFPDDVHKWSAWPESVVATPSMAGCPLLLAGLRRLDPSLCKKESLPIDLDHQISSAYLWCLSHLSPFCCEATCLSKEGSPQKQWDGTAWKLTWDSQPLLNRSQQQRRNKKTTNCSVLSLLAFINIDHVWWFLIIIDYYSLLISDYCWLFWLLYYWSLTHYYWLLLVINE